LQIARVTQVAVSWQ